MVWHLELQVTVRVPPADGQGRASRSTRPAAGGPSPGPPPPCTSEPCEASWGKGRTLILNPQHLRPDPQSLCPPAAAGQELPPGLGHVSPGARGGKALVRIRSESNRVQKKGVSVNGARGARGRGT